MDISREEHRAALQATVHDMVTPRWLRWTLAVAFTVTLVLMVASLLLRSASIGRASDVGVTASMLACFYWLARCGLVVRRAKREPREVEVKAVALALRRAGVEENLRQVRVAMVGGPWDGDVVPLLIPGAGPWPGSFCPQVGGVRQHYRLERVGGDTRATYVYAGECASGTDDA